MISWPRNLIEEIAYRRVIFMLGTGISATAKNISNQSPKDWASFLNEAKKLVKDPGSISFIDQMLKEKNFLMALQAIHAEADPGEYGDFLKREFLRPNYQASKVHSIIKELDAKIVITTNFDKIYDSLCNGAEYVICDHRQTVKTVASIKSPESIIIKAHGSIDDINEIIFTSEQYYAAKKSYPEFYRLLEALFLTNTVVFLGYSLNDPDINLVFEKISISSSPTNPHYVVIKEGTAKPIKNHWQNTFNIVCLEYGPDYSAFEPNLNGLKDQVLSLRAERKIP